MAPDETREKPPLRISGIVAVYVPPLIAVATLAVGSYKGTGRDGLGMYQHVQNVLFIHRILGVFRGQENITSSGPAAYTYALRRCEVSQGCHFQALEASAV